MTKQPEFIDNQNGNTLAQAIRAMLCTGTGGVATEVADPTCVVRIATTIFSPAGFSNIADHLRPVSSVRLLLDADLAARLQNDRKRPDESIEHFERRHMTVSLGQMDAEFRRERDGLSFAKASDVALHKLIEGLRTGNMGVRRFEKTFLHAKTYCESAHT